MPKVKLENAFSAEMMLIYQKALKEANYKASRFLEMLHQNGGLQTAQILLQSPKVSEGYVALWERGRIDLTVEAMIYDNSKWHELFSEEELSICQKRLIEYGYLK